MPDIKLHKLRIPAGQAGQRLDRALAALFPQFSRSRLKQWIEGGEILLDGVSARPSATVFGGEQVVLAETAQDTGPDRAEDIPLEVIFEDSDLIVINKPVGLVVHPGAGNRAGTLVNALINHDATLASLPRAGLIHRLDKDTSGLLLVARNAEMQLCLGKMLADRAIGREYQAVCSGVLTAGGTFDDSIGRHPTDRRKMIVRQGGRTAVTHYRIIKRFAAHTHVRVQLETGRTHQIRVHFAHHRHPLVGDLVYGGRLAIPAGASEIQAKTLQNYRHQALHAWKLNFTHPRLGTPLSLEAGPPSDFSGLVTALGAGSSVGP